MKQADTKITVGSLVELIREDFTDVVSKAAWKIGDIAKVIEVDDSSIPYRIRIGKYTTWCNDNDVKLYVPKETVVAAEVLPQPKYKVGDCLRVLTNCIGDGKEWCTYGALVTICRVDITDPAYPYLVCPLETTSTRQWDVWLRRDEVELYVPEPEEVFFKTQQEIWKYLSESEEHSVTDEEGTIVQFKNGSLTSYCLFTSPEEWKPYIAPESKDWWELVPEGTEVLCWYGDDISEKTGKPFIFGKVSYCDGVFNTGSSITWKNAVPVTMKEAKQYILSEILANEESN